MIFISDTCLSDGLMHSVCRHPPFGAATHNGISPPKTPFLSFPHVGLPKKVEKARSQKEFPTFPHKGVWKTHRFRWISTPSLVAKRNVAQ